MPFLVIDTALEACSVAIGGADGPSDVILSEIIGRGHAERLFGMIEAVVEEARIAFAELDRFAVTIGPGSLTGVRVGVAAVRGFMLVTGRPGLSLSTLEAHAESAAADAGGRAVLATLDARAGQVYGQLYSAGGEPLTAPELAGPEHFATLAERADAVLAGSGAVAVAAARARPPDILHTRSAPDPGALLRLAARAQPGAAPPRPLYLRPPDARPTAAGTTLARQ